MKTEVTGCENCPFRVYEPEIESSVCIHPNVEIGKNIIDYGVKYPNWCPLIIEPIQIRAKFQVKI